MRRGSLEELLVFVCELNAGLGIELVVGGGGVVVTFGQLFLSQVKEASLASMAISFLGNGDHGVVTAIFNLGGVDIGELAGVGVPVDLVACDGVHAVDAELVPNSVVDCLRATANATGAGLSANVGVGNDAVVAHGVFGKAGHDDVVFVVLVEVGEAVVAPDLMLVVATDVVVGGSHPYSVRVDYGELFNKGVSHGGVAVTILIKGNTALVDLGDGEPLMLSFTIVVRDSVFDRHEGFLPFVIDKLVGVYVSCRDSQVG